MAEEFIIVTAALLAIAVFWWLKRESELETDIQETAPRAQLDVHG